ncbi:MAG TPA: MMPL family transporter [Gemmataceae bacterium]|nr:MMPL family transporter [Gemmataceae bacterium]
MFGFLGNMVARFWPLALAAWILLLALSWMAAPDWDAVTQSGEVTSLPADSPSRRSEQLFRDAFPDQYAGSNIVVVIARQGKELQDEDRKFIQQVLTPRLQQAMATMAGEGKAIVARIRTLGEQAADVLLVSQDRQATLVVIELTTAFLDRRNNPVVDEVEMLVDRLCQEQALPAGLALEVTGIATAGRDLLEAESQSIRAIERWTFVIVVGLLLLLYRAPLMALIPLVTVFVGVQIALNLLALMARAGILGLDRQNRIFITVLAYGAGVDYCLFLIARYREELESGAAPAAAVAAAIARVGGAITASAGTVICGIGMLAFARFARIHQAGLVIPFALFIVLGAASRSAPRCCAWRDAGRSGPSRWRRRPERPAKAGGGGLRLGMSCRMSGKNWALRCCAGRV